MKLFSKTLPIIDLIVPGLLNLPVYELPQDKLPSLTPALHKLLRFAHHQTNECDDIDSILIHRLGLNQSGLPYAHAVKPNLDSAQVLFKPVYLKSDINNAVVFPVEDSSQLDLLINDLSAYFNVDCGIKKCPDNSWLMTLHHIKPVNGMPHYLSALGKKVTQYQQQATQNLEWFKLFNEMQMFLFQHEINQQREQQGKIPVNSLWCWGGDAYQGEKILNTPWFSDDYLMQRIGRLYCGSFDDLDCFNPMAAQQDSVIIDLSILKALKGENKRDLMLLLIELENNLLKPIMDSNSCNLIVHTGGQYNFEMNPAMRFKFWLKKHSLKNFLSQ